MVVIESYFLPTQPRALANSRFSAFRVIFLNCFLTQVIAFGERATAPWDWSAAKL